MYFRIQKYKLFLLNNHYCQQNHSPSNCYKFGQKYPKLIKNKQYVVLLSNNKEIGLVMISILLIYLFVSPMTCSLFNQTVSIQSTNQTFFTYVPLSQSEACNYSRFDNISQGGINYTYLDPISVFNSIELMGQLFFWGSLYQGIRQYMISSQLLMNGTYNQIVLFNSTISKLLTSRELILVNYDHNGNIYFHYAQPLYNYSNNLLTPIIKSNQSFSFDHQISVIINDCNRLEPSLQIVFIGDFLYLGFCPNTSNYFVWNSQNPSQANVYKNSPILNGSLIQNITNNPDLLHPYSESLANFSTKAQLSQYWNTVILLLDPQSTLFCFINLTYIRCQNYEDQQVWVQIIVNRAWGVESIFQLTEIELILAQFPSIQDYTFPGDIVSVFAYGKTIYIQSKQAEIIYLAIFQDGIQLANTTLEGPIIYYGRQRLLIQTNLNNYSLVDFILPMYNIYSNDQNTQRTLDIDCENITYQFYYSIIWSSIEYPLFQTISLKENSLNSYQSIYVENLNNYYEIIGPAFEVFIQDDTDLTINLMDVSLITITETVLTILNIIYSSFNIHIKKPLIITYYNQHGQIKNYDLQSKTSYKIGNPCGFTQPKNGMKLKQAYLFLSQEIACICDGSYQNCQLMDFQKLPFSVSKNTNSVGQFMITMNQIHQSLGFLPNNHTSLIKKQLYDIIEQNLLISIYTNNTVTLTDLKGKTYSSIQSGCQVYNSTNGCIFTRNFYDDYIILYCQNQSNLSQYYIRNSKLELNRQIPIYGFITTNKSDSLVSGQNYMYLQVKLNPEFLGSFKIQSYTKSCCILRLDPNDYTVSVIAEIILANNLLVVESIFGVDVVSYNQTDVKSSMTYIKVFFDSSWISYEQDTVCTPSNNCSPITNYQYDISFLSVFYNFGASFNASITYDISASVLQTKDPNITDVTLQEFKGPSTVYNKTMYFNFNTICGPIQSFNQTPSMLSTDNIFTISTNLILTQNKILENIQAPVLQIINIQQQVQNIPLSNLIFVVGYHSISIYNKFNGIWMDFIEQYATPQQNCLYFVVGIINNTAISLGSNCYNLEQQTPLMIVSYDPSQLIPINVTFTLTYQIPTELRSIQSVLVNLSTPLLFGLGQGPSKSISGILYICSLVCNSLIVDSKVVFYIDFDSQETQQGIIVVGLDLFKISFWINPPVPIKPNQTISAQYFIYYQTFIQSNCTKIKIVYGSSTNPNFILSCSYTYEQYTANLAAGTLQHIKTFNKFANCQIIDKFKPLFILEEGSQSQIISLIVQCQQNIATVRLQQVYTLNSNNVTIITGYLQVYTSYGPLCPNPNNLSTPNWAPIRIILLGTSMNFMLYSIYYANNNWKIVYEEINGKIVDNFLSMEPFVNYQLMQLNKNLDFPEITMVIYNPYYQLTLTIQTNPEKKMISRVFTYVSVGIFILFNLTTIAFGVCWCFFGKKSKKKIFKFKDLGLTDTSRSVKSSIINPNARRSDLQNTSQSSQIASKSKRRVTQIELFQPR